MNYNIATVDEIHDAMHEKRWGTKIKAWVHHKTLKLKADMIQRLRTIDN